MGNTGRNFFIMLKILLQTDLKLLQNEYFNKKQKKNSDLIGNKIAEKVTLNISETFIIKGCCLEFLLVF